MDPSTCWVAFQLNNLDYDPIGTTHVQPLNWNPAVCFRRARIIAGGQVIEDIDDFNELSLMLTSLKSVKNNLRFHLKALIALMINMAMFPRIIVRLIVILNMINRDLYLRVVVLSSGRCSASLIRKNYCICDTCPSRLNWN